VDGRGSFISATPAKGATAEVTGRPWKALAVPTADKSRGWGANGLSAVLSIALPWAVHRLALSLRFGTVAFKIGTKILQSSSFLNAATENRAKHHRDRVPQTPLKKRGR
jgi:hypothetical protein